MPQLKHDLSAGDLLCAGARCFGFVRGQVFNLATQLMNCTYSDNTYCVLLSEEACRRFTGGICISINEFLKSIFDIQSLP